MIARVSSSLASMCSIASCDEKVEIVSKVNVQDVDAYDVDQV